MRTLDQRISRTMSVPSRQQNEDFDLVKSTLKVKGKATQLLSVRMLALFLLLVEHIVKSPQMMSV